MVFSKHSFLRFLFALKRVLKPLEEMTAELKPLSNRKDLEILLRVKS